MTLAMVVQRCSMMPQGESDSKGNAVGFVTNCLIIYIPIYKTVSDWLFGTDDVGRCYVLVSEPFTSPSACPVRMRPASPSATGWRDTIVSLRGQRHWHRTLSSRDKTARYPALWFPHKSRKKPPSAVERARELSHNETSHSALGVRYCDLNTVLKEMGIKI